MKIRVEWGEWTDYGADIEVDDNFDLSDPDRDLAIEELICGLDFSRDVTVLSVTEREIGVVHRIR